VNDGPAAAFSRDNLIEAALTFSFTSRSEFFVTTLIVAAQIVACRFCRPHSQTLAPAFVDPASAVRTHFMLHCAHVNSCYTCRTAWFSLQRATAGQTGYLATRASASTR
jgi:hypothetical protein